MRQIIKVWVRFLTRARTQTFLRLNFFKRFAQSHLRAAAENTHSAVARWRENGFWGIVTGAGAVSLSQPICDHSALWGIVTGAGAVFLSTHAPALRDLSLSHLFHFASTKNSLGCACKIIG